MKLREMMTREVETVQPNDTLKEAARKMRVRDVGFLPVCDGDQILGVITDRDIILKSTAEGTHPSTKIGNEFITAPVIYCYDDEDVEAAAKIMEEHQIRRVAILNRDDNRLVGILSLGDIATNSTQKTSAEVLQSVSEPTG